jgi:hypothetical protein
MSSTREQLATNLFLLEELEDVSRTRKLSKNDLDALRTVADWTKAVVAMPDKDLGRAGPVCPFVPRALDHDTLWLAPEQIADRSMTDVVALVGDYQRLLLDARPTDGGDAIYKSIVVVFTDLSANRAGKFFDDVLQDLAVPSYAQDGFVMGEFYHGNQGPAIYNSSFRPFMSPVPLLLIRQAVVNDWKFFLNNEVLFKLWTQRYAGIGAEALAEELRHLPWNRISQDASAPSASRCPHADIDDLRKDTR